MNGRIGILTSNRTTLGVACLLGFSLAVCSIGSWGWWVGASPVLDSPSALQTALPPLTPTPVNVFQAFVVDWASIARLAGGGAVNVGLWCVLTEALWKVGKFIVFQTAKELFMDFCQGQACPRPTDKPNTPPFTAQARCGLIFSSSKFTQSLNFAWAWWFCKVNQH